MNFILKCQKVSLGFLKKPDRDQEKATLGRREYGGRHLLSLNVDREREYRR